MTVGDTFGWGLVGPGKIAHRFAEALHHTPRASLVAVQGRDIGRSSTFARKWSRPGAPVAPVADIEAILRDPHVHGVYIATPHAFHGKAIRACIAAGKPVLCEKPLVPHHAEGVELTAFARRQGVFLMEAVWTRFLPVYEAVGRWLREGAIGRVRGIQSTFCYNSPFDRAHRNYDPDQAGGSLLDLGVYNLTMARWVLAQALGECPPLAALHATGVVGESGVDHRASATLEFAGGIVAQSTCAFDMSADNTLRVSGENGFIAIPLFWQATHAELHATGRAPVAVDRPFRVNGFEYEIEAAMNSIRAGDIQNTVIPHAETLATLEWMDRIRAGIGVRYPFEV